MSFAVNVHRLFWLDISEAKNYYDSVSANASDNFDEAFDIAYKGLEQNLDAYFKLLRHIRRIPVPRFPYQIVYAFKNKTIYILCLHHTASNKKEWKKRSKE